MKKLVLILTVVVFLVGMIACGGGEKYGDVKAVMNDLADAFDGFGIAMEKAEDGKAVVAAINDFADKMKTLQPKMEEIKKKYPDLKGQTPEELKEVMKKMEEAGQKLGTAMGKIMQFATDPAVMEAQKKLQEAMLALK